MGSFLRTATLTVASAIFAIGIGASGAQAATSIPSPAPKPPVGKVVKPTAPVKSAKPTLVAPRPPATKVVAKPVPLKAGSSNASTQNSAWGDGGSGNRQCVPNPNFNFLSWILGTQKPCL